MLLKSQARGEITDKAIVNLRDIGLKNPSRTFSIQYCFIWVKWTFFYHKNGFYFLELTIFFSSFHTGIINQIPRKIPKPGNDNMKKKRKKWLGKREAFNKGFIQTLMRAQAIHAMPVALQHRISVFRFPEFKSRSIPPFRPPKKGPIKTCNKATSSSEKSFMD